MYVHSNIFPKSKLFYSYDTCGGSAEEWETFITTASLVGATIRATVPGVEFPAHFKLTADDEIAPYAAAGSEYYDDSVVRPCVQALACYPSTCALARISTATTSFPS